MPFTPYLVGSALNKIFQPSNPGVNNMGGFKGDAYGTPNTPGFDEHGNKYDPVTNPAPGTVQQDPGGSTGSRENAFEWMGRQGGAAEDANRYRQMGDTWGSMQAPATDYSAGNQYAGMGMQARGSQADALGLMQSAAQGNAPSQAEYMMRQGNNQAMANSLSLAAGARGAGAMAGAQQSALGQNAAMATNNISQMGALRANEMAQARGAYGALGTSIREGDARGMGMMDARTQYGADLAMRNRQQALNGQLGYEQMGYNVNNAQMGGQMGKYGAQDQQHALQVGLDQHSTDRENQNERWLGDKILDTRKP